MVMHEILGAIQRRQKLLSVCIDRLEKSIAKREQGNLLLSTINGSARYYMRHKGTSEKVYLNKDMQSVLDDILQRQYEENLLASARLEMKALERSKKTLSPCLSLYGDTVLFNKIPEELREHVHINNGIEDDYVKNWRSARYYRAKTTDKHIHDTLANDKVRSKSEVLIADRLFNAGIPYRYEEKLVLEEDIPGPESLQTYYPDFTILKKSTREIVYWEHLGKMGDPAYCRDNLAKLHTYMRHGIVQGKNLIITYESADIPLFTKDVDTLIREFLL